MGNMFGQEQAALLSIQLLVMCHVHADNAVEDHKNTLVSRGDSATLTCNISVKNVTQIRWRKGSSVYVHSASENRTSDNFTSHRIRISVDLPITLNISNAQHEDAGLYQCHITDISGPNTISWNLTVSEKPKGIDPSWYFLYMLTPVVGFLLCVFISSVCICRKLSTRTPNQDSVQTHFHTEPVGEVVLSQPIGVMDHGTNHNHRRQYMERLNSIYGLS
ncbi:hypothetical protein EXN66_Car010440 [Channa argus]|uniref:Ig-like domain-containing protein n=1 Tax=Channa argus TaxID=215402 RepID=A0A6G1PX98_CHAAH|nr:hypothetical protein EXN66_Car010440 [Channa argus]KAK2905983.1 hypothetical protein Q8A73_009926 [Channa argus]